eukprot:GILI01011260.1.p1 GENE.GILI01011260.1~~GILI01011260.1.p1  ORF type:complete len:505 (-),score=119.57 GILI01011260.1:388-1902(-)
MSSSSSANTFSAPDWQIGLGVCIVSNLIITFGLNLIKLSRRQKQFKVANPTTIKAVWYVGTLLFTFGNIFQFFGLGLASMTLVACTGNLSVVGNIFFSVVILREPLTVGVSLSGLLVLAGFIVSVIYSDLESSSYTWNDILQNSLSTEYIVYSFFSAIFVVLAIIVYYWLSFRVACIPGFNNVKARAVISGVRFFSFTVGACLISVNSLVLAKAISELLYSTLKGDNQFMAGFTYIILFGWVVTAYFWLWQIDTGLRLFASLFYLPIVQCVWTLGATINGGLYFMEFRRMSSLQVGIYSLGVIISLAGVASLSTISARAYLRRLSRSESEVSFAVSELDIFSLHDLADSEREAHDAVHLYVMPMERGVDMITFDEETNVMGALASPDDDAVAHPSPSNATSNQPTSIPAAAASTSADTRPSPLLTPKGAATAATPGDAPFRPVSPSKRKVMNSGAMSPTNANAYRVRPPSMFLQDSDSNATDAPPSGGAAALSRRGAPQATALK